MKFTNVKAWNVKNPYIKIEGPEKVVARSREVERVPMNRALSDAGL